MSQKKIKVVVVDDSDVIRMVVVRLLESDPQISIIGSIKGGQEAIEFIKAHPPDAIVMDIHMPGMDGFETTRHIMETQPVPIIICTATADPKEMITTFRAMEAGAVACIEKPVGLEHPEYESAAANLLQTVKLMSEVRVVRRWAKTKTGSSHLSGSSIGAPVAAPRNSVRVIGIGASTGGPPVLQTILGSLPKDFPVPILVVQHIAQSFLPGLSQWLNQTTGLQIQIASYGTRPLPGHVYLAPDGFHMGINAFGRIMLSRDELENGSRPSVSYLFRSLAEVAGNSAIGVLLTGMGRDGAEELKMMRDAGAMTIAQNLETSVVHGMPGYAISIGAAIQILPADQIAGSLAAIVSRRNSNGVLQS